MPPRKRKSRPRSSEPPASGFLDWTDSRHWNYDGPAPCRYCKKPALLRDSKREPAHKVCAEAALAARAAEAAEAYQAERLGD